MRRQLNIVYVTTEGAWLHKDGENLVMEVDGKEHARLPVHMLEGLVCIGRVLVSPQLMGFCAERGITISFLSANGRFLARVEGPVSGNVLLRRAQYRASDHPPTCGSIVRHLLSGKLYNQRAVIARALRDHGDTLTATAKAQLEHTRQRLTQLGKQLWQIDHVDTLRGIEGEAAQGYFTAFAHLLRTGDPAMRFSGRNRRPPRDPVNAVLSFLYTLLTHDCRSALESTGLDPAVGFLHRDRPGRPSLALDLMEEFRPVLADRLALSMFNRHQLGSKDFRQQDGGGILLSDGARKAVLVAYQERKRDMLQHAFLDEKLELGLFPFIQARLLARHLRGDLDAYPPFLWK